jgi:hypothetical protein
MPDGPRQVMKVGNNISTLLILKLGTPQGCVLSPLLYSLFTHDCVAMHVSDSIIKFSDSSRLRALGVWSLENNLSLNVIKIKEMIVDFRK